MIKNTVTIYCVKCGKNYCSKCIYKCIDHKDEIKVFDFDKSTINKREYIFEKIKDKNQTYIDNENNIISTNPEEEDNIKTNTEIIDFENNNIENIDKDIDTGAQCFFIRKVNNNNNIMNDEIKKNISTFLNKYLTYSIERV